jgi:hypothetical protein
MSLVMDQYQPWMPHPPHCKDPEKVKLEERVAELERRLDALAEAAA